MTRPVNYPNGAWPTEMRADTAAAYCDEPSVEAFLAKVRRRIYPEPCRQDGMLPKWHRLKLDQVISRRHGLLVVAPSEMIIEDVAELI